MKKILLISCFAFTLACNNATTEKSEPKKDTSAASSADSILRAVEKMQADSAAKMGDSSTIGKDTLKK